MVRMNEPTPLQHVLCEPLDHNTESKNVVKIGNNVLIEARSASSPAGPMPHYITDNLLCLHNDVVLLYAWFRFRPFIVIRLYTAGIQNCPAGRAPVSASQASAGYRPTATSWGVAHLSSSPAAGRRRRKPLPAGFKQWPRRHQRTPASPRPSREQRARPAAAAAGSGRLYSDGGGSSGGCGLLNRHSFPSWRATSP